MEITAKLMNKNNNKKRVNKHRGIKVIGVIAITVIVLIAGLIMVCSFHTQFAIGIIQKFFYQSTEVNSYEAAVLPSEGIREDGQYLITGICYGETYPNSFLNIQYPNSDVSQERRTILYIHGGGYFYGSALTGDPMAADSMSSMYDRMCADGYNVVTIDYCLVPDHRFPDPVLQLNQAIEFLIANAEEYHLDMEHLIIMGSSAGAIMTAQYGTVVTNAEYAAMYNITPTIPAECISALVVDDAPLYYKKFNWATKVIIGNYLCGNIWPSEEMKEWYDPYEYLTAEYPDCFLIGSSAYGSDMRRMYDRLQELGVTSELCYPSENSSLVTAHCFITEVGKDETADAAYAQMMNFIREMR